MKQDDKAMSGAAPLAEQGPRQGMFASAGFGLPAALLLAGLLLAAQIIWPLRAAAFNQEGGLFETASAAALLAAGLVALVRYPGLKRLYIVLVCLLLAERELEADVYAEGSSVHMVLSGLDTLLDMTLVRVVLAVLVIGGLVWHGIPNGWRAFKGRARFLVVFLIAGLCAFVAQGLEEISGLLGDDLSETMLTRLFVMEETLEMFFSFGILASVLVGWRQTPSEGTIHDRQAGREPHTR